MLCRHCQKKKAIRPRGLCWRCYYRPGVLELYPSTSKYAPKTAAVKTVADYEAILAAEYTKSPHWYPSPWPCDDPRYAELVRLREKHHLPARHPMDPPPDLR